MCVPPWHWTNASLILHLFFLAHPPLEARAAILSGTHTNPDPDVHQPRSSPFMVALTAPPPSPPPVGLLGCLRHHMESSILAVLFHPKLVSACSKQSCSCWTLLINAPLLVVLGTRGTCTMATTNSCVGAPNSQMIVETTRCPHQ